MYHVRKLLIGLGLKWRENVTDVNNNNDVTSTSALPFVEFIFRI